MPRAGIEPATRGFSVLCSTNWAIWANRDFSKKSCDIEHRANEVRDANCFHRKIESQGSQLRWDSSVVRHLMLHNQLTQFFYKSIVSNFLWILDTKSLFLSNSGDRIWTYDLRVMSPTSFLTAPPRVNLKMGRDGFEPSKASLTDLQSAPFGHSGICPLKKPMIGLEPITCWLQISCSANWATSA